MNKEPVNVLLVCDASIELGSGHVMRQITLGAALKDVGLHPILFCFSIPEALVDRALGFGIEVRMRSHKSNSAWLSDEILATHSSIVVFDGYEFNENAITKVFDQGTRVVLIDDNGDMAESPCHLIINQNLHANASMYDQNLTSPRLLLGLSWALIRPEVCAQMESVKDLERTGIFISIGGTDHLGLTPIISQALKQRTSEEIVATHGVGIAARFTPTQMAAAMSRARVGIIALGTTTWEAIFLKLPFVGIITAANQELIGESLIKQGLGTIVDCRAHIDVKRICEAVSELMLRDLDAVSKSSPTVDCGGSVRCAIEIQNLLLKESTFN